VSQELCICKWEKLIILKEYHIEENGTHVILSFLSSSRVPFFKKRTKEKRHTDTHSSSKPTLLSVVCTNKMKRRERESQQDSYPTLFVSND
jgi:hypothetical protein